MEPVFPMPDPTPQPLLVEQDLGRFLELLHESQERKAHLLRIQAEVSEVKRKTLAYVADLERQRRQLLQTNAEESHRANTAQTRLCLVHEQLRRLLAVCEDVRMENGWPQRGSAFTDAIMEAEELMKACEPYLK